MNTQKHDAKFTGESGWQILVRFTKRYSEAMFKECKTWDDVTRCADMGDFEIAGYDIPNA